MLRPTVSRPVCLGIEHPSGAYDQIFITLWQLRSCFYGVPSLTRGRVCLLYKLLALGNVIFLGSQSLWTCNHILLSQIWDFPFRRLLRLAGSRWRYSTPPPHGLNNASCLRSSLYSFGADPEKIPFPFSSQQFLSCHRGVRTSPLRWNGSSSIVACTFFAAKIRLLRRCLAMDICLDSTIPAFRRHVIISP
jgi:hypothetical protein